VLAQYYSYGPVSVHLFVTSQSSVETHERISWLLAWRLPLTCFTLRYKEIPVLAKELIVINNYRQFFRHRRRPPRGELCINGWTDRDVDWRDQEPCVKRGHTFPPSGTGTCCGTGVAGQEFCRQWTSRLELFTCNTAIKWRHGGDSQKTAEDISV